MSTGIGIGASYVFRQVPLGGPSNVYTDIDNSFSMEFDGVGSYYDAGKYDDKIVKKANFAKNFACKKK